MSPASFSCSYWRNKQVVESLEGCYNLGAEADDGEYAALFDSLAADAVGRLHEFPPAKVASTAWAFATASHLAPHLFDEISVETVRRLDEFTPQELTNVSSALATNGHSAPTLFAALATHVPTRLADFNVWARVDLAWSFAVLDVREERLGDLFTASFFETCKEHGGALGAMALRHLWQWTLWREEIQQISEGHAVAPLPHGLRELCREAFLAAEAEPSVFRRQVLEAVRLLGHQAWEATRCTATGYRLDVMVDVGSGSLVGLEADSRDRHVGSSQTPTAQSVLKHRQVHAPPPPYPPPTSHPDPTPTHP